ncbi:MAG: DUF1365 family protein [Rhodobacteraceae bacterium]|nr:DUF1365 family protein [Paracoccaceae bacterium]
MSLPPEHIAGFTTHARRGNLRNAFRYGVDYLLIDPTQSRGPALFSRNRRNLMSVRDRDHGGRVGQGRGLQWAREVFETAGLEITGDRRILLLTQPNFFGYTFNPVSFWLVIEGEDLLAAIAEVTNTMRDRHSYLCHLPGFRPITKTTPLRSAKIFHVSPFQQIDGGYQFNFDIRPDRIAIRILHENGDQGVIATLWGDRKPLTNGSILRAAIRRPLGAFRTVALIYWQAVKLKLKGAPFKPRPEPPEQEVS